MASYCISLSKDRRVSGIIHLSSRMDGVNLSGKAVRIAFRQNLEEGTSRLIFKLFEWLVELVDQRSICSSIADGHITDLTPANLT